MTDRDQHLSLALDALTMLTESLHTEIGVGYLNGMPIRYWDGLIADARANIEAATTLPKPGLIRRWFDRSGRRAA